MKQKYIDFIEKAAGLMLGVLFIAVATAGIFIIMMSAIDLINGKLTTLARTQSA